MAELAIKMTSEDQQAAAAVQRLTDGIKESEAAFDKTVAASHKAAAAAQQAAQSQTRQASEGARLAQNLIRQSETLEERYRRQRTAIDEAHRDGKIGAEQHARAVELLSKEIADAAEEARQKARVVEAAAEAEQRAIYESSDAYKVQQTNIREGITLTQRMEDKTRSLADRYDLLRQKVKAAFDAGKISADQYARTIDNVTREQHELEAAQQKTVGPTALASVAKLAAGYLSIHAAINLATRALKEYHAEQDKGRSQTESLQESRRRLFQVSDGDFGEMEARADKAAETYGVDRALARQVLFTARSEGFEDQYEQVVKLVPIIDPQAAATVAGQVRTLFSKENVSVDQAINAVLEGARKSRLSFEGITAALPMIGEGGRQQGASMDESIAAASVLSSVFKSGETTGDRLKNYLSKLALDPNTAGKGLLGGFDALMQMPQADRDKFLGDSVELNAVHAAMLDLVDEIRAQEVAAARQQAGGTDNALAEFYSQPGLAAFKQSQAAEVRNQISQEGLGELASNRFTYRQFINARMNNDTDASYMDQTSGRFIVNRLTDLQELLGIDPLKNASPEVQQEFRQWQQEQLALTRELVQQGKTPGGSGPAGIPITRPGEDK